MYCEECGLKCEEIKTGKFDKTTGNPKISFVCPSNKCGHEGIFHKIKIDGLNSPSVYCVKCGISLMIEG